MTSLAARAVKHYARTYIKRAPANTDALVRGLRKALNNNPLPAWLPLGVKLNTFSLSGIHGDWLRVKQPERVVLYLHGGGYMAGITETYRTLCGRFAKALNADVFMPAYRLAPEHPFPAAIEDAFDTYRMLLQRMDPGKIIVAGDSAGGGLSLGLAQKIRDEGLPLPGCIVVYSPFTDMSAPAGSRHTNEETCDMFLTDMFDLGRYLYTRNDEDMKHPYASPVYGDFTGLPPMLMTVEETEILRDDTYRVADLARAAGLELELIARHGLLHVWPIFYPLLPEAREDVKRSIDFMRRHTR